MHMVTMGTVKHYTLFSPASGWSQSTMSRIYPFGQIDERRASSGLVAIPVTEFL